MVCRTASKLYSFPGSNNCSAVCLENEVGSDRYIVFDRFSWSNTRRAPTDGSLPGWWRTSWVIISWPIRSAAMETGPIKNWKPTLLPASSCRNRASRDEAKLMFSFLGENDGPPTHPLRAQRFSPLSGDGMWQPKKRVCKSYLQRSR